MDAYAKATRVVAITLLLFVEPLSAADGDAFREPLTLERVLALARERAPRLAIEDARIEEARGRLAGVSPLLPENPVLDVAAGRNLGADNFAAEVGLLQPFELGGGRASRIAEAEAQVERETAARDDSLRLLQREAAGAFFAALYAQERVRVARESEAVAAEVERVAARRYRADDVPVLDWNVSLAALARARAERLEAEAAREGSFDALRILLDMPADEPLELAGTLGRDCLAEPELRGASQRPDLEALEAALRASQAEAKAARAEIWPDVGVGASYQRDDGDDIALGVLQVSPPIFQSAQGERAQAKARSRRLRLELDAARRAIKIEVRSAQEICALRAAAAQELEQNALPLLDDNELLARRSYETGQIGLAELLEVRRLTLEIRREHLARRLEAALAGVELAAAAGVLR